MSAERQPFSGETFPTSRRASAGIELSNWISPWARVAVSCRHRRMGGPRELWGCIRRTAPGIRARPHDGQHRWLELVGRRSLWLDSRVAAPALERSASRESVRWAHRGRNRRRLQRHLISGLLVTPAPSVRRCCERTRLSTTEGWIRSAGTPDRTCLRRGSAVVERQGPLFTLGPRSLSTSLRLIAERPPAAEAMSTWAAACGSGSWVWKASLDWILARGFVTVPRPSHLSMNPELSGTFFAHWPTMRATVLLICLLCVTGCDEKSPVGPTVPLNERFTLSPGEIAVIDDADLRLQFVQVTGDSRCPADAICIQGGDAIVQVRASDGDDATLLGLHTGDASQASAVYRAWPASRSSSYSRIHSAAER